MKPATYRTLIVIGAIASAIFLAGIAGRNGLRVKPGQPYAGGFVSSVTLHIDGSQAAIVWMPNGEAHCFIVERPK